MSNVLKMLSRGGAAAAETDPNFNQTVLLLHGDGTNGAQNNTFLDSSTNNFTITRNGNTTQGTFSPFSVGAGEWSNYFDGNNDYFTVGSSTDWTFLHNGSSWTIEFDVFHSSTSLTVLCSNSTTTTHVGFTLQINSSVANDVAFYFFRGASGSFAGSASSANLILNAWNHVGITFDTSTKTLSFFINGVASGSSSHSGFSFSSSNPTYAFHLGVEANSLLYDFSGYLSNFRISDTVRTGMTTVPTTPYTNDGNTRLLTCQSNRFVDNSSSPKTITRNGDVRVTPFSPFAPTAAYSAGTNGGSGYFDGSGDYLTVADNVSLDPGSSNFTIEAWVYPITNSGLQVIHYKSESDATGVALALNNNGAGKVNFYAGNGSWYVLLDSSQTIPLNAWSHIAGTRSGNTWTVWVNGVSGGTATNSTNPTDTSELLKIGRFRSVNVAEFNGYISNYRFLKGTAIDFASTGIPTAPLTAITNTSLLLNFTNAGIIDNTGKNNLETVGNAQIDTTTKKYGTGSLEFDGTGDYLLTNGDTNNFAFGSGDFTIEFWVYPTSVSSAVAIVYDGRPASTQGLYPVIYLNNSTIKYFVSSADRITGSSLSINTWYHIAITRSGTSTKMFVNGTQSGSTYTDSNSYVNAASRPVIGASGFNLGLDPFTGYIDDLRITKGVARYTANFTAPTKEFPDQ